MKIVRILRDKSFEQGGNNVVFADAIYNLGIEVLDLLAIPLMQDLQAIAFFDVSLGPMTRDKEGEEKRAKNAKVNLPWRKTPLR
jgi:hypothetical protein